MMANPNHAFVRFLIDDKSPRQPVGAGFLVAPRWVLSCAHVVLDALNLPQTTQDQPKQTLFLDFPFVDKQPLVTAKILAWHPPLDNPHIGDIEDLVLLELSEAISLPDPLALVVLPHSFNRAVRLTGFPQGRDEGVYLDGKLKDLTGEGRVQIDTEQGRGDVAGGFSGSAVYDNQENAVVGLVVSIDTYGGNVRAYMIPAETIIKAFPQLEQLTRSQNPYKNLFAFTEDDVEFFFGREQATEDLYHEVLQKQFITVLGASGSGKSSVVLAGLMPRLKQQQWQVLKLRLQRDPFRNIALALIPFLYADKLSQVEKLDELSQKLQSGEFKFSNLVSIALKSPFLIVIDQFEELFTQSDSRTQQTFLACLLEIFTESHAKVLITLRADFMGQALAFDVLAHCLKQNAPYLLTAMQHHELEAAIEKPAAKLGVRFAEGLVELLLKEVGTEVGKLPLLQFTLTKLWEKQARRLISFEAYQQLGGLEKALVQYADEVWQSFQRDEKQQTRLRYLLLQLVSPGLGTEDTRQIASRAELQQDWSLVQELANRRLVITGGDGVQQTVEVVHEVLIKHWPRMQEWLKEDRAFRIWQNNLRVALKDWLGTQDDGSLLRGAKLAEAEANLETYANMLNSSEKNFIQKSLNLAKQEKLEKERRRKRIFIGLSIFLVVVTILATIAGWQWYVAQQQTKKAVQQKQIADKERDNALIKQSLFLADLSHQQTEQGDAVTGMLLALEALPISINNPKRPYVNEAYNALYYSSAQQQERLSIQHGVN